MSVPTQTLGCQPGVPRGSGGANANWSHIQGPWSTPKEILLWVIWVVRAMQSPLPGLFPYLCLFTSSPWLAGKQIASMFFRQKKNKGASHEVLGDVAFLQKHSHLGLEWHRMRLTTAYRGTLCAPFSPSPASYMESEPLGPFLSPRRHFLLASMIEAG